MSIQNGERLATKQDLADFYNNIRPYMGGLVSSKAGFTPIGTIISVMGTTAPVNYLACDGTVYNIADYTELANYFNEQFGSKNFFGGDGTTTFAVPDLRGEFLRGTGTNSHANQGSGANVGEHQDSTALLDVTIANSKLYVRLTNGESFASPFLNVDSLITGRGDTGVVNYSREGQVSNYPKCTLRPTNTSVLYCIATKNFYIDPTLDYSTDEKVVGTWVDGKPIWQKTFVGTTSSNKKETDINHGIEIETPIATFGYVNKGSQYVPTGFYNGTNFFSAFCSLTAIELRVQELYYNCPFVITIQYTKTTS